MSEKLKIAIFGGSFDPFHMGHLKVIEGVIRLQKFDKIIVMPLGLAPHKETYMTSAGYRYEMARLALKDYPQVHLSDYEINRPGKYSYTLDTINYFEQEIKYQYLLNQHSLLQSQKKKQKPKQRSGREDFHYQESLKKRVKNLKVKVKISLVYGSDALDTIESWHEPGLLMRKAKLLICRRGDEDLGHMNQRAEYLRDKYQANIQFFDIEETTFSGTEIRQEILSGNNLKEELPKNVRKFIQKNRFYDLQEDMMALSKDNLVQLAIYENEVRKMVSRSRLIHSLNVMHYAVHLARIHHYDLMKTATTAILHDIAKAMRIKKQYKFARKMGGLEPIDKNIAHGPAGAFYISGYLNIKDPDILNALTYHTTSRANMTTLDKIIYLSDKIEFGRPFKNLDLIREAAEKDLDEAMKICLNEVKEVLKKCGRKGHPQTLAAMEFLND